MDQGGIIIIIIIIIIVIIILSWTQLNLFNCFNDDYLIIKIICFEVSLKNDNDKRMEVY